ncbi:B3 domain-containing transcription factor ABI3 isoform X1 [Arachis duranensis]|uniref:B3 domain-containing transcription factor ABI3 isoform X1 n=1 Tax=Arachis duranensis TaxID=130453 RepID=A0A6P4CF28_ARADU|nr:B3 domain-containing transcription factor ABI3 isoform X1 [Arachis duranensis]
MKSEVEVNDAGFGTMDDANNNTNKNIEEDLSEVNYEWFHEDPNLFYDDFPPLPDLPCISSPPSSSSSSSSFSSSKPAEKPITACSSSSSASSSSSSSCAALRKDMQKPNNTNITETEVPLCSTTSMDISQTAMDSNPLFPNNVVGDCMDMMDMEMEPFGFIDFLEEQNNADFFDPDSIFQHNFLQTENESEIPSLQQNQFTQQPPPAPEAEEGVTNNNREEGEMVIHHEDDGNDEMSSVFLEWLKTNKDKISASDLRSVKLKKSTIESAAKRLGGGKQGMKRLLKLILEWVQTNHLKNKNPIESSSNPNNCFNKPQLSPLPPPCIYASHNPALMVQYPPQPAYVTDAGADYINNKNSWPNSQLNSFTTHYNQPFGENHLLPAVLYGNQYPYQLFYGNGNCGGGGGDHGWRRLGPLATKEARKKRMARQRKCSSNQRQNNHWGQPQNQSQVADTVTGAENWVCWQGVAGAAAPAPAPALPAEPQPASLGQNHGHQGRGSSDKRPQGWKSSEKNLKFLLQKVLKQSDVGSLGRIVLPKKEAETHLPELDARDGISIDMEDIGTSQVWNMRYSIRYWPNNKSRMYLLENTGDFVKANGLQEGDFIVIYSDLKCGKFMIRGVKVRQAGGTKSETKTAAGKSQKNQHTVVNGPNNNATSSSRDQPKMKI